MVEMEQVQSWQLGLWKGKALLELDWDPGEWWWPPTRDSKVVVPTLPGSTGQRLEGCKRECLYGLRASMHMAFHSSSFACSSKSVLWGRSMNPCNNAWIVNILAR